jgi:acyl-CoA reductase-like NAD-dependent aldehyde dehydrogenase
VSEQRLLEELRAVVAEAVAERRGLVAFTRLAAAELDRMARQTEHQALLAVWSRLPEDVRQPPLPQVLDALRAMQRELDELEAREDIRPESRSLARDEVVWQTFERVAGLLGVL